MRSERGSMRARRALLLPLFLAAATAAGEGHRVVPDPGVLRPALRARAGPGQLPGRRDPAHGRRVALVGRPVLQLRARPLRHPELQDAHELQRSGGGSSCPTPTSCATCTRPICSPRSRPRPWLQLGLRLPLTYVRGRRARSHHRRGADAARPRLVPRLRRRRSLHRGQGPGLRPGGLAAGARLRRRPGLRRALQHGHQLHRRLVAGDGRRPGHRRRQDRRLLLWRQPARAPPQGRDRGAEPGRAQHHRRLRAPLRRRRRATR